MFLTSRNTGSFCSILALAAAALPSSGAWAQFECSEPFCPAGWIHCCCNLDHFCVPPNHVCPCPVSEKECVTCFPGCFGETTYDGECPPVIAPNKARVGSILTFTFHPSNDCGPGGSIEDSVHWKICEQPNGGVVEPIDPVDPPSSGLTLRVRATGVGSVIVAGQLLGGECFEGLFFDSPEVTIVPACPGEVTGNNTIDVDDLLLVQNSWGMCPPTSCCAADVDQDGDVDVDDLLAVINNWGQTCAS